MARSLRGFTLILAIVATSGCGSSRPPIPVKAVLVPNQEILPGTKLMDVMFSLQEFPVESLPLNAIDDPNALRDRVCIRVLPAGIPLTPGGLVSNKSFRHVVEPGYQALTISGDLGSAIMGYIPPGSYLDVIAVVPDPDDPGMTNSSVFLRKAKVLGVNTTLPDVNQKPTLHNIWQFTLMVKPEDFERGQWIKERGKFTFYLHHPKQGVASGAQRRHPCRHQAGRATDVCATVVRCERCPRQGYAVWGIERKGRRPQALFQSASHRRRSAVACYLSSGTKPACAK